jgi:glycosyltransferase involved in cell wall biosynthesis
MKNHLFKVKTNYASPMVKDFSELSVVMISRNEEKAIAKVITEIQSVLPGSRVVVVDGSTDRTAELARRHGAIVIKEPGGGYGPALNCAVLAADTPFIATVDADDTYPPIHIEQLLDLVKSGFDVAGGSRISGPKPSTMPWLNFLANKFFSFFASLLLMKKARDIHSGMRVYRREIIREISWKSPDLGFTVELLLYPMALGKKIIEIPITYRERIGISQLMKMASARATIKSINRSFRFKWFKTRPSNLLPEVHP